MKQKLLFIFLLIFTISFANPKTKTTTNPAIGVLMKSYNQGMYILFEFRIKNIGEEPLTNIYVTQTSGFSTINFEFTPITTLMPGEEIGLLYGTAYWTGCYDESQTMVHATTTASTEITDLSDNPDYFEGHVGTFYTDGPTTTYYSNPGDFNGYAGGIYSDLNENAIIDIGDAVYYYYSYSFGQLIDVNAIILSTGIGTTGYEANGIHYLTAEDIATGYVYSNPYVYERVGNPGDPCYYENTYALYNYSNPCFCPNPNNAYLVTPLVSVFPNQISGNVKFNVNGDDCSTGLNFPNRRISTSNGSATYSSFTNNNGDYHILIPNSGNFTTSALVSLGPDFSSDPPSLNTTSSGTGTNYNNTNFCISSATNHTDLSVNMFNTNQAIPGSVCSYRIYYSNIGSTNLSGTIQLYFDDTKLSFIGTPTTSNSITWPYSNLLPFESRYIDVSFNAMTPPAVNMNDILSFTVTGNPIVGDINPDNNTFTINQIVRSSYDPNDKTVIEGNVISLPLAGNYLTYVTRFQNTGTANATTVVIKDVLDPKLDWDTFEPIASSHPSNVQIQNGNAVTYTFSNIDLAYESASEPESHGWMVYKIKPKNNVAVGDIMSSNSNIYFDYNPAINTNTVNTEITALASTHFIKSNFSISPNPASNYLLIKAETNIAAHYEIIDINGKLILNGVVESMNPININVLQSGFYFMTIKTNQGNATYKFIKN